MTDIDDIKAQVEFAVSRARTPLPPAVLAPAATRALIAVAIGVGCGCNFDKTPRANVAYAVPDLTSDAVSGLGVGDAGDTDPDAAMSPEPQLDSSFHSSVPIPPRAGQADGDACQRDANCSSDHCAQGVCCQRGACCNQQEHCQGHAVNTCVDPFTCTGMHYQAFCTAGFQCAIEVVPSPEPTACTGVSVDLCAPFLPQPCSAARGPDEACTISCSEDTDCAADAECEHKACKRSKDDDKDSGKGKDD